MNPNLFPQDDTRFEQDYRTAYLIAAYIQQRLTPAEREELDEWVGDSKENLLLFEELTDDKNLKKSLKWFQKLDVEKAKRRVQQKLEMQPVHLLWRRFLPYAIAASLLLIIGTTVWFYMAKKPTNHGVVKNDLTHDVMPAGNKAILTLADGRSIVLDRAANGSLAQEGISTVMKNDSQLTYQKSGVPASNEAVIYNTLSVPQGGQYQLLLSDGTKVWLNAASTLRFPASFTGKERSVELKGEGYFEVAKNKAMPFYVLAQGMEIKVVGTHFNVQAYEDEKLIRTTLVEGSVRVLKNSDSVMLQPGDQAQMTNTYESQNKIEVNHQADIEAVLDWKNGLFVFRDTDIKEVMRIVERWYNVKVVFKASATQHFNGTFDRRLPLTKLLHYLEGTNQVHFNLQGNNLTVLP